MSIESKTATKIDENILLETVMLMPLGYPIFVGKDGAVIYKINEHGISELKCLEDYHFRISGQNNEFVTKTYRYGGHPAVLLLQKETLARHSFDKRKELEMEKLKSDSAFSPSSSSISPLEQQTLDDMKKEKEYILQYMKKRIEQMQDMGRSEFIIRSLDINCFLRYWDLQIEEICKIFYNQGWGIQICRSDSITNEKVQFWNPSLRGIPKKFIISKI